MKRLAFTLSRKDQIDRLSAQLRFGIARTCFRLAGSLIGVTLIILATEVVTDWRRYLFLITGIVAVGYLCLYPLLRYVGIYLTSVDEQVGIEISEVGIRYERSGEEIYLSWLMYGNGFRLKKGLALFFYPDKHVWMPGRVFGNIEERIHCEEDIERFIMATNDSLKPLQLPVRLKVLAIIDRILGR